MIAASSLLLNNVFLHHNLFQTVITGFNKCQIQAWQWEKIAKHVAYIRKLGWWTRNELE